jgi:hypothetical protein
LPDLLRYQNPKVHGDLKKRDEVLGIVKSLNIPVIDIHENIFANHPDPTSLFPFRAEHHYSAEGYSLVASTIIESIEKNQ